MIDKQQAQEIIKETFESSFDKDRFTGFIKNLLNRIDEDSFIYHGKYIPDAYKQYIKTLDRIGKFSDKENSIDILVITLRKETSLERARTMQRNFVAWYLNGSRGGEMKDVALAAFVSPGKEDWRFSLVKMDYKFEKTNTGRMKIKEEFTPARRWSFLVGANEKSHTAQSRLVNILADDEQAPTLEQIEKAFDIETVTKEFFLKYRELFLRTKEDLDKIVTQASSLRNDFAAKGVDTVNFAKKLLGQIIFLYFLQKKGWFGVGRDDDWGTGSKHFLRELFEKKHAGYNNFFNDILEPLFYEALRIDRSHDDGYYSRFDCKIPFLNGGLFDPIGNYDWVHTDILIPDKLFSNNIKTKEGDIGTGILDVFDRYNFTVKEDEPLEKEVAIDPELLGKAYEKFNAIRPDNYDEFKKALKSGKTGEENKFNKKFGVYYTPREIVHYMCQQSLINYLATELDGKTVEEDIQALIHIGEQVSENEARVLSKGKETKTYSHQLPASIRNNAALIDDKLAEITVCDPAVGSGAFPVGMMSEIVKTRNVLTNFIDDNDRTIYDFKRHCIEHSLYGVDIDPGAVEIAKLRLWLSLVVDEDNIKNIKPLPNLDYKIMCGNSLLRVEKNLFNLNLFTELEKLKPLFFNETSPTKKQEYKKQIDKLISEITSGHTEFDFEVYFSEVFLSGAKSASGGHHKGGFDVVIANPPYGVLPKKYFNNNYQFIKGNNNTYIAFLEKALMHISNTGVISYIIPTTWLAGNNFKDLRKYFLSNGLIQQIVQLPYDIFENAYIDNLILILKSSKVKNEQVLTFKFQIKDEVRNNIEYNIFSIKEWLQDSEHVIFLDKRLNVLLYKYRNIKSIKLGMMADIQRGTLPPKQNELYNYSENNEQLITWFDGQVYRYFITKGNSFKVKYNNLNENKPLELFKCEKLFGRQLISRQFRLQFSYFNETAAFKKNLYAIYNLKEKFHYFYVLAILNSTFYSYVQVNLNSSGQRDDYPALSLKDYKYFLIPVLSPKDQSAYVTLVSKILSITKSDDYLQNQQKQAKVKTLEAKIDQLVYKLYDLTREEIKIVERKN